MATVFADRTVGLAKGSFNENITRNFTNKRFECYNLELSWRNNHEPHKKNIPGLILTQKSRKYVPHFNFLERQLKRHSGFATKFFFVKESTFFCSFSEG